MEHLPEIKKKYYEKMYNFIDFSILIWIQLKFCLLSQSSIHGNPIAPNFAHATTAFTSNLKLWLKKLMKM